jgi:hypothetical protein
LRHVSYSICDVELESSTCTASAIAFESDFDSLRQPLVSELSRTRRTLSAACIRESGTLENLVIPSAHGRCAGNRGRSSCRSPKGSSRSGRRTRGRSRRSRERHGRRGRRRWHQVTVAFAANAPLRIRGGRRGNLRDFSREHRRDDRRRPLRLRGRRPSCFVPAENPIRA